MQQWMKIGTHQVNELLARDEDYLSLLAQRDAAEAEYLAVMQKLSQQDRQAVDRYIMLCEEIEYKRTVTAYRCGRIFR